MKRYKITLCVLFFSILSLNAYSQTNTYPPPGELVDVNGYQLHLLVEGKNKQGPTVVFFHGAGDIALNWNLVLPEVGKFATAVAIDQAGEGWSDHGHGMSLFQQVYDSHTALEKAGFEAPYILVGQSLGGILANIFAKEYPTEVGGVVMVDAAHPDVLLNVYNKELGGFEWKIFRTTANEEIPPVIKTSLLEKPEISTFPPRKDFGDMLDKFSESDKKLFNWIYNERPWPYVKGYGTYEAEIFAYMYNNKPAFSLKSIPLIVLTGGQKEYSEGDKVWTATKKRAHSESLQKDLLNLSSDSKQIIVEKSGHHIHIDRPEVVVNAIKDLVRRIK